MSRLILPPGLRSCRGIPEAVLLAGMISVCSQVRAQDTTPPVLVGYTYSPTSFDVTPSATAVTGTIQASDNSSGLQSALLAFYSPTGSRRVDCQAGLATYTGTLLVGTFACSGTFPRYTETGQWVLQFAAITDKAGNTATYLRSQLMAMGLPTTLTLTGTADLTPPSLTTYSFSPAQVSVGASAVTLTGTITATDNLAGLYFANIAFYGPSGQRRVDCYSPPGDPGSGTPLNGTYTCSGQFEPGTETGPWVVRFVELRDQTDNTRYYTTSELAAMGLPTTLTVTAATDSSAPTLTGLTLSPLNIQTASGSTTITGVVQATDVGSGVKQAVVALYSPSGGQRVDCATAVAPAGSLEISMPCTGLFPQGSEAGAWEVRFVTLSDHAGNVAMIQKASLQQSGYPVLVSVSGGAAQPALPALAFTYMSGSALPTVQQVQVLGAALPWVVEKESSGSWLSVSPASGTAPAAVSVSANPAGLTPGTYHDTLFIREVIHNRVVARLPVTLLVLAAGPLTAQYFEPPLFETLVAEGAQAGEGVAAFVHLYWPVPN